MAKKSVIPFGPQHPVLPEPIHLDLVVEDEKIVEAIPSIGFIHRGLESLVDKRDFNQMTYVAERTCGICSFAAAIASMTRSAVPEAPRLKRSSSSPASPRARRFSSFAFTPLVYIC